MIDEDPAPTQVLRYGDAEQQMLELTIPQHGEARKGGGPPVVVLVHGGFWRAQYGMEGIRQLVPRLLRRGWAVATIEYRRVGQPGGGWPGTLADAAAAVDALSGADAELDLGRVAVAGHSAGGQLALWLAGRHRIAVGQVGSAPAVQPVATVSVAGVCEMAAGAREGMGDGAVVDLLGGGPDQVPERYTVADPAALLPLGVPTLLVSGDRDEDVTVEQSRAYRAHAAAAGDDVTLLELPGADHFVVVDPSAPVWDDIEAWLARTLDA